MTKTTITRLVQTWAAICLMFPSVIETRADLLVNGPYGDGMVIQRDVPVPVWGTAAPGEEVTVAFNGQTVSGKASADGAWKVILAKMSAGGPWDMEIKGQSSVTLKRVYVGDVWLCAGGQLADLAAGNVKGTAQLIAQPVPLLRIGVLARASVGAPVSRFAGRNVWMEASMSGGVAGYSGLGLYFGMELQKQLGEPRMPVGIMVGTSANTLVESWTPRAALEADAELKPIAEAYDKAVADYRKSAENYIPLFQQWVRDMDQAENAGASYPQGPPLPPEPRSDNRKPCGFYNGTIAPLIPFPVKGVVWSHGELNIQKPEQHKRLLQALIGGWRAAWGGAQIPFLMIEVSPAVPDPAAGADAQWVALRESQKAALSLPGTAIIPTADIGNKAESIPEIAKRCAQAAMKTAGASVSK
ncbi:MAG: hypothetical protein PCFJNLEI_00656 [Verrucomicrobiae bacterium]|nr:hypothetical protein [Verrucomicrobiae bacterium]